MAFVIDASATLPWRFADESTPWTEALLDRVAGGEDVIVPAHWPLEIVNGLLVGQRKRRVTETQVSEFLEDLAALPIRMGPAAAPSALACRWPPSTATCAKRRLRPAPRSWNHATSNTNSVVIAIVPFRLR